MCPAEWAVERYLPFPAPESKPSEEEGKDWIKRVTIGHGYDRIRCISIGQQKIKVGRKFRWGWICDSPCAAFVQSEGRWLRILRERILPPLGLGLLVEVRKERVWAWA